MDKGGKVDESSGCDDKGVDKKSTWRRITIAKIGIVVLFIAICAGFSYKNNVCKTWSDYTIKHVSDSCKYNPDVNANMISIVQRYNYKIQTHYVLTEDDYILTVFRIANSSSSFNSNRQPIFLQHGTICSSEIWLQRGEDSIGFHLANAGFDVWLGNTRGNYNSPGQSSTLLKIEVLGPLVR
ncbi:PREDICTED: lysosomal acid lipase/cholesteryl ester hydrolase-like [Nicrophorus vespilloides]|uniref:Lysosomal acid lipase/cholesteryl ester hydrolase-like n=1 Tax=Nicrophorus vespilloides TaxID=110193 RepID=A0ABM1MT94_NICVS|nr:PREDICTED: lysosomal acid lipase/cholesteryl ester hydrolase-like [Nicrophorus vespilloides]XP_017777794.1 PREDICTED: lysosomal acid lipase/cholesteryl ester hydrolase-like [Nicrophorus vespilloides]